MLNANENNTVVELEGSEELIAGLESDGTVELVIEDAANEEVLEIVIPMDTAKSDTPPANFRETDPNSYRQRILQTMHKAGKPLKTGEIKELLKAEGLEFKWIHSHIAYFKEKGQVIHNEDKTYQLSKKTVERLELLAAVAA